MTARIKTALAATLALAMALFLPALAGAAITGSKDGNAVAGAVADGLAGSALTGGSFPNMGVTACADGDDDDGNGLTDFPADPFCASAADDDESPGLGGSSGVPECMNGTDDDGSDGIDLADPDCTAANDASEEDAGTQTPECSTPAEDDGEADGGGFPEDPECVAADDDDEDSLENCGDGEDDNGDGIADNPENCAFPFDDDEGSTLGSHAPAAVADTALAGFPVGGASYAILSTGNAEGSAEGGIDPGDNNEGVNNGGHGEEVNDLVTLRADLDVPEGLDCVSVDYRFLTTEETDDEYNDSFLVELDTSNFTVTNAGVVTAPNNFATVGGAPVGVHTASFSDAQAESTNFDRATAKLTASRAVTPGAHAVFFSTYDADDRSGVSAAFVDNLFLGQMVGGTCVRDTKAPEVKLSKKPKKKTSKRKATFRFKADEPATTFECKLNKKAFKPCTSPTKVKAKKGKNKFSVRATDPVGNVGGTETYAWKFKKKRKK